MGEAVGSRVRTHRHPADLRPQVPEVQCGRGAHRQLLQNVLILQGLALCREAGHSSGATPALTHRGPGVGAELYSLGSRRRDWRAGYHCGSAGRAASQHTAWRGLRTHSSSNLGQGSGLCGSRTQPGRALAEAGSCPSENQARAFLPVATRGRCNRQAQKVLGSTMGISAGTRGRGCQEGSHPQAPAPRGCGRQCGRALHLRLLVKRFLISAMVAWGST